MSQIWMDGFDHYGGDEALMLDGAWAEVLGTGATLAAPSFGARTGTFCLRSRQNTSNDNFFRRVLGADFDTLFVGFGLYLSKIPNGADDFYPIQFRTNTNTKIATMTIRSDGGLAFRSDGNSGTILGQTTGPVLVAGSWQFVEVGIFRSDTVGTFEIRVGGVTVLSLSALDLGLLDIAQLVVNGNDLPGTTANVYMDDLIVRDETGTTNNTFMGDLRVATLQPVANGAAQGWATRSIQKLDIGVMDFLDDTNADKGLSYLDDAVFEVGSGDFCLEDSIRFTDTIGDDDFVTLFSKWRESTDERSWRLILNGANLGGNLVWQTCTDGLATDVVDVISFPFVPIPDRWYDFAVDRETGVLMLLQDGVQLGVDTVDVRAYHDNAASLFVNGSQNGINSTIDDESVNGWMDGFRFTVGSSRYRANYTPATAALPADLGGDPLYDFVELLLNFDNALNIDESANAFSGTLMNGAAILFPADSIAYQTINELTPDDNNFVEASLVPAEGTLTFTDQPLDTETVTLGATTYIFQTVLVDVADNVLIGATTADSLDNLRAAVNHEAGEGTLYGTGTVANLSAALSDLPGDQLLATALTAGTAGNTITSTETLTDGAWSNATLLGGLDIPTFSDFVVSALPAEVTGIRSVAIVGRSRKTDGGASELTHSFVTSDLSSAAGVAHVMTLSPVYYEDTYEQDPSTAGNLTPSSINGSMIRLDRTL
jgi:hypothetical protein